MNRRGFLAGMLAACAAPAVVKAGILMPSRGIIVPSVAPLVLNTIKIGGNRLLTMEMITREALGVLNNNLVFATDVARDYDGEFIQFARGTQWNMA